MAGIRDIKRRIRSVKNTQQITRAMKMVAAAKLRKSQERLLKYRPFGESHHQMIGRILARMETVTNPLLKKNEEGKRLIVVLTSDKGLCGGFNQHIMRLVENDIASQERDNTVLYIIGKKGRDYFKKRGYSILKFRPQSVTDETYNLAHDIADEIIAGFLKGDLQQVDIAYSQFQSAMTQHAKIEQLIPLSPVILEEEFPRSYSFEPSPDAVLDVLLPLGITLSLYRCLLETVTSEHGSRMTSMESATNNATEMIASLTLIYNKARQAAITKEIIEIVSGADALT